MSNTPRTDAAYDAKNGEDGPDRIDRMLKTSEELERERNRLFLAITDAVERFDKICWGWDGDCGAGNIMRDLEEVRDAVCTSNPSVHPSPDASAGVGGATRCSRPE